MHARAVGIEDSRYLDFKAVLPMIVEEQRFGATLAFIVAGARPNGIDVAPVGLRLRMDRRITVDLAGRGLKNTASKALGETQHIDGAMHRRLGRLHWIMLIVD